MSRAAREFDRESFVNERTGRLEERVDGLRTDVTEIRADARRIEDKVEAVKDSLAKFRVEMKDSFLAVTKEIAACTTRLAVMEHATDGLAKTVGEIKQMLETLDANQRKLAWAGAGVCGFVLLAFAGGYAHLIIRSDNLRAELTARSDAIAEESRKSYQRLFEKLSEHDAAAFAPAQPAP